MARVNSINLLVADWKIEKIAHARALIDRYSFQNRHDLLN
jgi:hypothetical protein